MSLANPFIYSTPDQIEDPNRALELFVDVFKDFYLIESIGNTFINGPRGSGKSMMFRIMKPDCQKAKLGKPLKDLNYYAVYIPIKDKALDIEELSYLKHGEKVLNEHLLTTYFSIAVFKCLEVEDYTDYGEYKNEVIDFYNQTFKQVLHTSDYQIDQLPEIRESSTINDIFSTIREILEGVLGKFSMYVQKLSLVPEDPHYSDELCLFNNFLSPLINEIIKFSFLPPNRPIYFLVDDANWLNYTQTRILNSWVSYRSTSSVCFKITTQQDYKTYYTVSGRNKIDSPHDYHVINLIDIYTSNQSDRYKDNVKKIVEKRLQLIAGITTSAEDFFPANEKQERELDQIFAKYKEEKNYDYAYRNARVDYMLNLSNQYTYSYGGFEQLVHLSSGIIRNFIDMSFKMFDQTVRNNPSVREVTSIPIAVQDHEAREYANWFFEQLDRSIDDDGLDALRVNHFKQLRTIISSIGKASRLYLESSASERRKFSFYFDGNVNDDVKQVLKIAISEGFFHYSTHGSKSGLGRSHKYVLNRILSPVFKLDPFSFSGYLYLTPERIEQAMNDEKGFCAYIKERIKSPDADDKNGQLEMLFENGHD